ncbi:MAG: hypothetical protein KDA75_15000 [Planctomycetaceae bacterium]|nr:hypothetical protein [Planctomycetaceae bacterium]
MSRFTTTLAVTLFGLALNAANAQNPLAGQALSGETQALELPPLLPPNDDDVAAPQQQLATPQQQLAAPEQPVAISEQVATTERQVVVSQQPGQAVQQLVVDPSQPNQLAYFSPRLGARFLVEETFLPQFGNFWAARIVSEPEFGSPLCQLGLDEGDLITRMDGLPVMSTCELERHILDTGVRFIRAGGQNVFKGTMYINPQMVFVDPYNPGCNPHQCGTVALRP